MAGSVFEQFTTNDKVLKVAEIHEPPTVAVAKTLFPHHMYEQGVVESHLGIQITHVTNVTFRKPPLNCV